MNTAAANLLLALSLLGPHGARAHRRPAAPAARPFVSPPLPVLSGERVAITLPAGWKIVQHDADTQWATPMYTMIAGHGTGKSAETRRIDILLHPFTEPQFHGTFKGIPFTTVSGLKGVGNVQPGEAGTKDWYLTVLPTKKLASGYIEVRLHFEKVTIEKQRAFATFVFSYLRFVKRGDSVSTDGRLRSIPQNDETTDFVVALWAVGGNTVAVSCNSRHRSL